MSAEVIVFPSAQRASTEIEARAIARQKGYAFYELAESILIVESRTGRHVAESIDWSGILCFVRRLPPTDTERA